jgi:hypothetical protein
MSNEDLRVTLLLSIERLLKREKNPEDTLRQNTELAEVLRKVKRDFD